MILFENTVCFWNDYKYRDNILEPRASMLYIEFMFSIGALYKDANIFITRFTYVFFKRRFKKQGGTVASWRRRSVATALWGGRGGPIRKLLCAEKQKISVCRFCHVCVKRHSIMQLFFVCLTFVI